MNLRLIHAGFWVAIVLGTFTVVQAASAGGETVGFTFREPRRQTYHVLAPPSVRGASGAAAPDPAAWLLAWRAGNTDAPVLFSRRVTVQWGAGTDLEGVLSGSGLRLARPIGDRMAILEAADAQSAIEEAQRLAARSDIIVSRPVQRRAFERRSHYALAPNDPLFLHQWHLENRDPEGLRLGVDLAARAAWSVSRGQGVVVAIVDDGIDPEHPDLEGRRVAELDYNFYRGEASGAPAGDWASHGTPVAGLVAAEADNALGVAGVAPEARLASWVIFDRLPEWPSLTFTPTDEQLMDMFQSRSNIVSVQNHSWGYAGLSQLGPGPLEAIGISNAVRFGREGKGVILVRAGGNGREGLVDANDDGYLTDPSVIAVGAVRSDGRAASYSSPGACLLVAAPSSDANHGFATIVTTDRTGIRGLNQTVATNDAADYLDEQNGFTGTSAAAPQIAGVAALLLSANPSLTVRDVQQILVHSARQHDRSDPGLATNGAGWIVSHNTGFGVPDADEAAGLARRWPARPPPAQAAYTAAVNRLVPDDGARLWISGSGVPANLLSIPSQPSLGVHPDDPTDALPLVYAGLATNAIEIDLRGRAALLERGESKFIEKIERAAAAGAAFAVIYNNRDGDELLVMGETEWAPIPAVFIGQNDGQALRAFLDAQPSATAQLRLNSLTHSFWVTNTLALEHVRLRVDADHPVRGDLRITLLSPMGTRSVLQRRNDDSMPGPEGWTYLSTHHFQESSAGLWTAAVTDEYASNSGRVLELQLILQGIAIEDADRDGLDDAWERRYFMSLALGPQDDPDGDTYANAREQVEGTHPFADDRPLRLDLSVWNSGWMRLSWPGRVGTEYQVLGHGRVDSAPLELARLPGAAFDTEWFFPAARAPFEFFRVQAAR